MKKNEVYLLLQSIYSAVHDRFSFSHIELKLEKSITDHYDHRDRHKTRIKISHSFC